MWGYVRRKTSVARQEKMVRTMRYVGERHGGSTFEVGERMARGEGGDVAMVVAFMHTLLEISLGK